MLRNTYLYENRMFTNNVDASSFYCGKGKNVTLIKRVQLMQEFDESFEGPALIKVGPSGPESVS